MSNSIIDLRNDPDDAAGSSIPASAIRCIDLTREFPGQVRPAVDHVSFEVEAGMLVVLLGPSGCGKTTLLKMINRLYEPTSGQVLIDGVNARDLPVTGLRRQIGYVIQQTGLFPHMTIQQNIAVVPRLLGWSSEKIHERTRFLLDMVGLPQEYLSRYPRQLSGGEQQRIGLARALAGNPQILLMDEPFGAIDAITRGNLQEELLKIHRRLNKTILFVTHDVEEAFRLADRIVIMRAGRLVQYDTPLDIVTHPQDEFVEELVGTGDMLRRLSLIDVQSLIDAKTNHRLVAPKPDHGVSVHTGDNLRTALSLLLDSNDRTLNVLDSSGQQVGQISFDDMRSVLAGIPTSEKTGS